MLITYPQVPNPKSLTIGVTAPSAGLGKKAFQQRFDLVKGQLLGLGHRVIEGACLREHQRLVSAPPQERAQDLMDLWCNPQVDLIHPPWGGDHLIDFLEHLDFERLKKAPKWIQGYSDTSGLLMAITLKTSLATAHGANFMDSVAGQDPLTANSRAYLKMRPGESWAQESSSRWQKKFVDFAHKVDATFNLTEDTLWRCLKGPQARFSGRLIGGCLDVVRDLVGTPYGDVPSLPGKKIIYLENCGLSPSDVYRSLWNMKYAGWFDQASGVVLGRSNAPFKSHEFSYEQALEDFFHSPGLGPLPVVWDADVGHCPPQMTLINGAQALVDCDQGRGKVTIQFL